MNYDDSTTRTAGAAGRGLPGRYRAELLCALLLALMAANMISVIRQKNITIDETLMIPAGYYHLTAGSFRPVNEHPPFAKILSALPLLFTGTEAPPLDPQAQADYGYIIGLFEQFWRANDARYDRLAFWSRVPMVAFTLLLGALIFVYARRLFGGRAALFAVALYALEPTVLAHGRVVQTDIPSAFAYLLFSFTLYDYVMRPGVRRAALVGLAAGLAVVTKFSMIVLGPVLAVAALALFILAPRRGQERVRVAGQTLVLALAAVLAVNAFYLFDSRPADRYKPPPGSWGLAPAVAEAAHVPLRLAHYSLQTIFPPDFVSGIIWQLRHNVEGHPAGLLGRLSDKGWWYYFPVAFALKTTLPFLLLSAASVVWALWMFYRKPEGRFVVLLLPLAVFTGLVMLASINIGVRYFLPAYTFLFILGGAFLDWLLRRAKHRAAATGLTVAVLALVAVEAVRAYPDQMTYMNQLAAGRPHWWYLSDSNVEWGDDIRNLALYLRERGETKVGVALLNWQVLERYGVQVTSAFAPPGAKPEETRYLALGASFLNGSTVPKDDGSGRRWRSEEERIGYFAEFARREPEKVFGNSIYLYRMKE